MSIMYIIHVYCVYYLTYSRYKTFKTLQDFSCKTALQDVSELLIFRSFLTCSKKFTSKNLEIPSLITAKFKALNIEKNNSNISKLTNSLLQNLH